MATKIIWTYWHSEVTPRAVKYCMDSWRLHNPDWTIVLVTPKNLRDLLPNLTRELSDSHAQTSDLVRVSLLVEYGGLWMDATIYLHQSLDSWLPTHYHFVGYYLDGWTVSGSKHPVIENWFMYSQPNTVFMKRVLEELHRGYGRRTAYVASLDQGKLQRIPVYLRVYLWMHLAIQKVLQENDIKDYKVFRAEDDAYRLHVEHNWSAEHVVRAHMTGDDSGNRVTKFRGGERKCLEKAVSGQAVWTKGETVGIGIALVVTLSVALRFRYYSPGDGTG